MPDSVIRANWNSLQNIAIIGNDLDFVTGKSLGGGDSNRRAQCTQAAQASACEVRLWKHDLRCVPTMFCMCEYVLLRVQTVQYMAPRF